MAAQTQAVAAEAQAAAVETREIAVAAHKMAMTAAKEEQLETYKANYLLEQRKAKIEFEVNRIQKQLQSAEKRLSETKKDLYIYCGMILLLIVVYWIARVLLFCGPIGIALSVIMLWGWEFCYVLLLPIVIYRMGKTIVLIAMNRPDETFVSLAKKWEIVTYQEEIHNCQVTLSRYYGYLHRIEQRKKENQEEGLYMSYDDLEAELYGMKLEKDIRIASPFAGRMQRIAGGTTVVIYVFLIALKFLPVLMEVL